MSEAELADVTIESEAKGEAGDYSALAAIRKVTTASLLEQRRIGA